MEGQVSPSLISRMGHYSPAIGDLFPSGYMTESEAKKAQQKFINNISIIENISKNILLACALQLRQSKCDGDDA
jgi:hypothetical protein